MRHVRVRFIALGTMSERAMAEEEDSFELTVSHLLYCNEDNGYAVVRGTRRSNKQEVTVVGPLGRLADGERIRVRGRWVDHPSYGKQLKASTFMPVLPTTSDGIEKFLASGAISGVGPAIAKRIVERFGDDTLEVISRQSLRLREVSGIGKKRAQQIAESVKARAGDMETFSFLQSLGLGPALCRAVIREHGEDAVRIAREDPYRFAISVSGMGFKTADRLGYAAGIEADDPRRARGAVLHLLETATEDGHVYQPRQTLCERADRLRIPFETAQQAVSSLAEDGWVVIEGEAVYAPKLHEAETFVAQNLLERLEANTEARAVSPKLDASLNEKQREAVLRSLAEKLLVITGGPGTGKTTTVRSIVAAHVELGHRIVLAAPTGRAAKRLEDATGHEALTIHRLLEWNPAAGGFARNMNLPLDAEAVLIDETSMVDLELASALFSAIPTSTHLILVGDVDQLPPVGPGQMLRDVINAGCIPTVRFNEVFRQASGSDIVRAAHSILRSEPIEASTPGSQGGGAFHIIRDGEASNVQQRIATIVSRAANACGIQPQEVQVMTPSRRGPLGTEALNRILQSAFNPRAKTLSSEESQSASTLLVGDKVMQLRNDYDRDVFNGDVGFVTHQQGGSFFVNFDGREVQYDRESLMNLTLAYACTVHKMQGSEVSAAVLVLHPSHHVLLSRALLYTAVTRAKELAVVVTEKHALARAQRNDATTRTYSLLCERLQRRQPG